MGAGASTLSRLRKAIVIRSYNLREADQTVDQQFRRFAVRGSDGKLYITAENIRSCLNMEAREYEWIDCLFQHTFGGQVSEIDYAGFLQFLESGKPPQLEEDPATKGVFNKTKPLSSTKGHDTNKGDNSSGGLPPVPPSNGSSSGGSNTCMTSSGSIRSIAEASAVRIVRAKETKYGGTENEEQVISINLSRIAANPQSLPDSVKLQTDAVDRYFAHGKANGQGEEEEDSLSLIIHPSSSSSKLSAGDGQPRPLWRKRETVRQERTVHYTTIDASGEQQELVEKETTQSEVLHMECKETGEFAHRETTQYEQMETFNEEVVAESKGAEEYVHLKSLEDEYHYMESTMPNRKGSDDHHHEQQPQQEEGQEGVEGLRPGEFQEGREDLFAQGGVGRGGGGGGGHGEALSAEEEAAAQQAALEAEYAEAYHLYQQKQRQDGEQQEQRSDGTARAGSMRAPSPRPPPPFSDDEAGQAYGFGRSAGAGSGSVGGGRGGGRAMDMQDAFAFAAAMDDGGFDDTFKEGGVCTSASETDAQQLFGETVEIAGEDEEQEREVGVPCCPRSNSNNINNSINSSSHQQHSKGAAYDKSHLFEPLAEPALAFAPPPAADPDPGTDAHKDSGNLTRASSYESLHEID